MKKVTMPLRVFHKLDFILLSICPVKFFFHTILTRQSGTEKNDKRKRNKQTNEQASKQTNKQTNKQASKQTNKQKQNKTKQNKTKQNKRKHKKVQLKMKS